MSGADKTPLTCGLCLQPKPLRESHLLPQWAYKRVRQMCEPAQHPVLVQGGTACMTSAQVTQDLLCDDCEDRFGQRENIVARLTEVQKGKPAFLQYLTPMPSRTGRLVRIDDAIAEPLAYFGASVLWRSSVMRHDCYLGPYEEHLRKYLNGEAVFPATAVMNVGFLEPSGRGEDPYTWFSSPASVRANVVWLHGFIICGLAFRCFAGGRLDQWYPRLRRICLAAPNEARFGLIIPTTECPDFMRAAEMTVAAEARGKLATQAQRRR